jgi:hypothetical protein
MPPAPSRSVLPSPLKTPHLFSPQKQGKFLSSSSKCDSSVILYCCWNVVLLSAYDAHDFCVAVCIFLGNSMKQWCTHQTNMTVNITCSIKIISVQPHNKWDTGQQHVDQHYSSGAKAEQRKQSRTLCASTLQHCNQKKPASDCWKLVQVINLTTCSCPQSQNPNRTCTFEMVQGLL